MRVAAGLAAEAVWTESRSRPRTATCRAVLRPGAQPRDDEWASRRVSCSRSFARSGRRRPGFASASVSRPTRARPGMASLAEERSTTCARARRLALLSRLAGIVPPPPRRGGSRSRGATFAVGLPLIATSRVVDVEEAERPSPRARRSARHDPRADHRPGPAGQGPGRAGAGIVRCIGCNACIAHYHAGTRSLVRSTRGPAGSGARSAGRPRAPRRRRRGRRRARQASPPRRRGPAGHEVVLLERGRASRWPDRPRRSGAGRARARARASSKTRAAARAAGVDLRLGSGRTGRARARRGRRGNRRRPTRPVLLDGDVLHGMGRARRRGARRRARRRRRLGRRPERARRGRGARRGRQARSRSPLPRSRSASSSTSTAATSTCSGSTGRACTILAPPRARIAEHGRPPRNVFAPELERTSTRTTSCSRSAACPASRRAARAVPVEEAGDCLSPRSLEEAVLEGTLAARGASSRRVAAR